MSDPLSNAFPALRFPEFNKQLVKKSLASVLEKMQSGISRELSNVDIGYPVLRSTNISDNRIDVSEIKYWHKRDDKGADLTKYILNKGDILVNFINSLAQIGKAAIYEGQLNRQTIYTTNIMRLRFLNSVDYRFVFYFFHTHAYAKYIYSITKPAVNQASFTTKEFGRLSIYFPSIEEQQKISDFLSAIDMKISLLKQKHSLLQQYKKGVMQQLFSQQIRFNDCSCKDFPNWQDKTLGELAGKVSNKNKDNAIKNVLTNSAKRGVINQLDYFDKDIANKNNLTNYSIADEDDFVYNPRISESAPVGPIKRNHIGQGIMSPLYTVFRFKDAAYFDYLEMFFQTTYWHRYMNSIANFGARHDRMNITMGDFFKLPIELPCEEEMQKIVAFVMAIEKKVNAIAEQIELTQTFKKGLLQQMFV